MPKIKQYPIILLKHLARNNNYAKVGFSIFMALILIFPSFGPNPFGNIIYDKLDFSLENFKKEVGYGANLLPEQKNGIFVQYPSLLTDYDYEIKYPEKIVVEHEVYGKKNTIYDSWNSPRLSELLSTDESQWKETIEDIDSEFNNEEDDKKRRDKLINAMDVIANSKFDFLIAGSKYGPPRISFIWISLALLNRSSDPKIANISDSYSLIFIPNIEQPARQYSHSTGVAIKKEEEIQLKNRLKEYYTLIFDDVCKHSEFVANNLIKNPFSSSNNIEINKTCNKSIGKFIDNYNNFVLFPEHISLIFFMMFIIMVVYTPFLLKRHNLEKNKEKIIYFGCMIIVLIISIIFLIKTLNLSNHYIEIAKQVKATFPY